jgi:glutamine synthetase
MFHLFKPKITSDEVLKKILYGLASSLSDDEVSFTRWAESRESQDLSNLISEQFAGKFVARYFCDYSFLDKYRSLSNEEILVIGEILPVVAGTMREFITKQAEINISQKKLMKAGDKTKYTWRFPDLMNFERELAPLKLRLCSHFPSS